MIMLASLLLFLHLPNSENIWAGQVIQTIDVEHIPSDIKLNPANNQIYVSNYNGNSISIIDATTNEVVDRIYYGPSLVHEYSFLGYFPYQFEFNPSNKQMYFANTGADSVLVIDSSTNDVIETISVGDHPVDLLFNPINDNIYVANARSDYITVIDSSTNDVIETISVGDQPYQLEFNPNNNDIYVSNFGSNTISVIDSLTHDLETNIPGINAPRSLEFNPANNHMYVLNVGSGGTSIIDSTTNEVIDTLDVGNGPYPIVYNPSNNNVYIIDYFSHKVSVIDSFTNEVLDTIQTGENPAFLLFNPMNNNMYLTNSGSDSLSIIDSTTNEVIDTLDVGNGPYVMELDDNSNNLYVVNMGSDSVSVIKTELNTLNQPIADAGLDQSVYSNDLVQLDGSNSSDPNDSTMTYFWNQTSGTQVTLSNPTSPNPTFVAPETNEQTDIVFQLVVTNEEGISSEPDEVTITVNPLPILLKPNADAGPDETVNNNDLVQLDGSNSSDPSGSPLSYVWTQTSGPVVQLSDSGSSNPTFTAPETNEQTNLKFELIVTNEEGISSEPDEVVITVKPITVPPPPNEEPKTIGDLLKGIIQNPLDVTNSIDSANEIRDILTDDNRDNDQLACDLLHSGDQYSDSIREILNC